MDANERQRRAADDANEWWMQMREGDVSRAQREQFVDWLRESPLHVTAMLRLAQLQGSLERFKGWDSVSTEGSDDYDDSVVDMPRHSASHARTRETKGRGQPMKRVGFWRAALAVGVVAFLVSGGLLYISSQDEIVETRLGERRELSLSDGSFLQIDPETRLRVRFGGDRREITLETGRAFFKVTRDARRPFIVKASDTVVRVLGTAFAVDRGKLGTVVTVAQGKVSVSSAASDTLIMQPMERKPASTILIASQQLTVPARGKPEPVRKIDPARELAWAEGRLVFDKTPIASALAQFNRYNQLQLRVTDEALGETPITGVFDVSEPESFVRFLEKVKDVVVTREEGGTPAISLSAPVHSSR